MEKGKARDVVLRVKRPEGYEDVHPEIVVSDMGIHPGFSCEVIELTDDEKRELENIRVVLDATPGLTGMSFLYGLLERAGVV